MEQNGGITGQHSRSEGRRGGALCLNPHTTTKPRDHSTRSSIIVLNDWRQDGALHCKASVLSAAGDHVCRLWCQQDSDAPEGWRRLHMHYCELHEPRLTFEKRHFKFIVHFVKKRARAIVPRARNSRCHA